MVLDSQESEQSSVDSEAEEERDRLALHASFVAAVTAIDEARRALQLDTPVESTWLNRSRSTAGCQDENATHGRPTAAAVLGNPDEGAYSRLEDQIPAAKGGGNAEDEADVNLQVCFICAGIIDLLTHLLRSPEFGSGTYALRETDQGLVASRPRPGSHRAH